MVWAKATEGDLRAAAWATALSLAKAVAWEAGVQDSQEVYAQITVVGEADSAVEWEEWEADSAVDTTVVTSAVEWVEADSVVLWVIGVVEEVVVWVVTAADSVAWAAVWVEVWEAMAADSVVWAEDSAVVEADTEGVDSVDSAAVEVDSAAVWVEVVEDFSSLEAVEVLLCLEAVVYDLSHPLDAAEIIVGNQ